MLYLKLKFALEWCVAAVAAVALLPLMAVIALFAAAPALPHYELGQAPQWARVMLFVAALQLVYLSWMTMIPDWSTVWSVMWVYAATAAAYATGAGILMFTPPGQQRAMVLGLSSDPVARSNAQWWSAAVVLAMCIACYLAFQLSYRWHKAYRANLELAAG